MASSSKFKTLTAGVALVVLAASAPAFAQEWRDPGYHSGWRDRAWREDAPAAYGYPGYGVDAGVTDIAVCPPGYHLGRAPGLCWPD